MRRLVRHFHLRSGRRSPVPYLTRGLRGRRPLILTSIPLLSTVFALGALLLQSVTGPGASLEAATVCGANATRTVYADVVALDQPFWYNRFGAINANGMMFALRHDVVVSDATSPHWGRALADVSDAELGGLAGKVALREDKRPRPLTLRTNLGDCLVVRFTNLLDPQMFVFDLPGEFPVDPMPALGVSGQINPQVDDQPLTRAASVHIDGLHLLGGIASDGSFVGENASSLAEPGQTVTYHYLARGLGDANGAAKVGEGTFLMYSMGSTVGAEGSGGTRAFGLFGAVNVEPTGAEWYRSQLSRLEMDIAASAWTPNGSPSPQPVWDANAIDPASGANGYWAVRLTADGQPIINYDAVYPAVAPFEDRAGLPIVAMLGACQSADCAAAGAAGQLAHSDLNAVITGAGRGGFGNWYPQNPALGDRTQPFREFTVIFHDEIEAVQAFPAFYEDPVLKHTLHSVRDGFAINYGTGGIGSEIIANRLGLGPTWDCAECKYEEFFLTSWAVGDPAMVVDIPANFDGDGDGIPDPGPKATTALYPADPSNVHHSYLNDRLIFRNLHAGPKEHHIFHLHAHQWLFSPNEPQSNYLDSQAIGPGSAYTYEIAYGGAGNRNKTAGDSIFHCHFYPHFAQGMWELWRVHDVFERGTVLDNPINGTPVAGARALADGEIQAGTPIPAIVPLPQRPMAPAPAATVQVVPYDLNGDGVSDSSQPDANGDGTADIDQVADITSAPTQNPGYPFWIAGLTSHRPPNPPLDLADVNGDGIIDDGGLPRHIVTTGPGVAVGAVEQAQTRLDFNKVVHRAKALQLPEEGTPVEQVAMAFHADRWHDTFLPDGTAVSAGSPIQNVWPVDTGGFGNFSFQSVPVKGFETNGLPAQPGAPYAEPCRTDPDGQGEIRQIAQTRLYKGANIQTDVVINKIGWHFPQQRFEALWEDVVPTLTGARPPEPLVMRLNTRDCAQFWHTNLVPSVYELDDYQVRTPTDIIGQHIHLVKFDVTSADGSANGWNYEDGTISPDETRERIHAFNVLGFTDLQGNVRTDLQELPHPFFGATGPSGENWLGARTTVQRWYADPLLARAWDGGVGTVFTHDHYGPSTHQQVGLYSTVLVEPQTAVWRDPETGVTMGSRSDGGPTSWRADILLSGPNADKTHREFYFEFADFQHAYEAGGGALGTQDNGAGVQIPSYADFFDAINPSFKQQPPQDQIGDLIWFPNQCPGGVPRPCPEAISADDPGTYVVNYRNEPVALRVFNGQLGAGAGQAAGNAGDLALAFNSDVVRDIPALNSQPGFYPPLTADVGAGDPYTPLLRVYQGDRVRVRVQVGAHEEEHSVMFHGLKWLQEGHSAVSGFRNSQFAGISEYFNLEIPVLGDVGGPGAPTEVDYLYTMGAQVDDLWNGTWGIMRAYGKPRADLLPLPNNTLPEGKGNRNTGGWTIANLSEFDEMCPVSAPQRFIRVTAVRAADVLGPDGIVYNDRATTLVNPLTGAIEGGGPLHDPTALIYVRNEDLVSDALGKPVGLKSGVPVEPLILRANAGDCLKVELTNALPAVVSDLPGFNTLPPIVHKNESVLNKGVVGITTFNANDLVPSSRVGLHAQLLEFNPRNSDGLDVGGNSMKQPLPGQKKAYTWYAGHVGVVHPVEDPSLKANEIRLVATPVELGTINLMPADRIKGSNKGLVGALVIEPQGATWSEDLNARAQATVFVDDDGNGVWDDNGNGYWDDGDDQAFREFVTVIQDDINLRFKGCNGTVPNMQCAVPNIAAEGAGTPEDSQDSGQKAINYGADPLWLRLGIPPNTPFGVISRTAALKDAIRDVFSNSLVGGDPQTPVYLADTDGPREVRVRLAQPGGHARGHDWTVHGHNWARLPYAGAVTLPNGDRIPTTIGHNPTSQRHGQVEGVNPSSHFDLALEIGGAGKIAGDYLYRDQGSLGSFQGLWGIIRFKKMQPAPVRPAAVDDAYTTPRDTVLTVAPPGVLANDISSDGSPLTAEQLNGPASGTLKLKVDGSFVYTPNAGFTGIDSFGYRACAATLCSATATVTITVVAASPPTAVGDAYSVPAGTVLTVAAPGVLGNDVSPDGSPLTAEQVSGPVSGTLTLNADGSFVYTPNTAFAGIDSFTYRACAGALCGAPATATIEVIAAPVADVITLERAEFRQRQARWTINGTGSAPGATITVTNNRTGAVVASGLMVGADGSWQFGGSSADPNANPVQGDTVTASSSRGGTATATVTIR